MIRHACLALAGVLRVLAWERQAETRAALDEARRLLAEADLRMWDREMAR